MAHRETRTHFWVTDLSTPGEGYRYAVSDVLFWKRSDYQEIVIVDTPAFGRALLIDGNWQSSVADEFLYHEPLVHPSMVFHGEPRRVAILGGGEGATLREVLRWRSVERVVMVDLDREVVEACRQHLPEMHQGAFDDPRTELVIGDAVDWLERDQEQFDVVISDLSEPMESGPAFKLFTKEYFAKVQQVLEPRGVFALQAGSVAAHDCAFFARVVNTVGAVFAHARAYASAVPSFGTPWGFVAASARSLEPLPDPEAVDHMLEHQTTGGLRMLDGTALLGLFLTPAHIRRAIDTHTDVFTLAEPPRR